ncbi:MAG: aminotransferase class III-fold pyridoxal phosphate-dependent enzyme [Rickettsia hoogstraalii]
MRELQKSKQLIIECQKYSASKRVDLEGTYNFIIDKGQGAYVWDVDGNKYIDYTSSTGAIILGYRYDEVDNAVIEQVRNYGSIFTTTLSKLQLELAKKTLNLFHGYEKVLFFRTGSCATTAAVRLARIYSRKK